MTGALERNIQAVAWLVLLAAAAVFTASAVGAPWLTLAFVRTATVEQKAEVACKAGSCALARPPGVPRVLRPGDAVPPVSERITVSTDRGARAFVRFFDGSTLNLDGEGSVELRRMRRPRFGGGDRQPELAVAVGESPAGVTARLAAGTTWRDVRYAIDTPHGRVELGSESHARLELTATAMRVFGDGGRVVVAGAGRSVILTADQHTTVHAGAAPADPTSGPENIVVNADFDTPIDDGSWSFRLVVPGEAGADDPGRSFPAVVDGDRSVVRIVREGSGGHPADMVYEQGLHDHDVAGASTLAVRVRLRVLSQSLPLGGMRGTELPAMVKLVGEAADGNQIAWLVGFHTRPLAPDEAGGGVLGGDIVNVEVPAGEWFAFDSGNLLDAANPNGFARLGVAAPARLTRLEIIASGHDYASDIDAVEVWVQ